MFLPVGTTADPAGTSPLPVGTNATRGLHRTATLVTLSPAFNTSLLKTKTTNSTQGVQALTIKGSHTVTMVGTAEEFIGGKAQVEKFRAEKLPSAGAPMKETDMKSLFDLEE